MVYFQGGGACWNTRTCDPQGEPTYERQADESDHPAQYGGIFDLAHPQNPVRDYSMVFVPYCTGDVHLGARDVEYAAATPGEKPFTVRHRGAGNVASALEWVTRHYPDPAVLFVTGTSAGAIPSPLYATTLARRYPRATVVQLGDGAGGYRADAIPEVLARWGAPATVGKAFTGERADPSVLDFETLYSLAGRRAPAVRYAQYNNAEDEVQLFFLKLLGVAEVPLAPLLEANLADMRRTVPWFRSYTAPGGGHGILGNAGFYTSSVDGTGLRDWVAALLEGRDVPDVGQQLLSGR